MCKELVALLNLFTHYYNLQPTDTTPGYIPTIIQVLFSLEQGGY